MGVVGGGSIPEYSSLGKGAPGSSPWGIVSSLVPGSLPHDYLYPQLLLHEIITGRLFHATEQSVGQGVRQSLGLSEVTVWRVLGSKFHYTLV